MIPASPPATTHSPTLPSPSPAPQDLGQTPASSVVEPSSGYTTRSGRAVIPPQRFGFPCGENDVKS